MGVNLGPAPEGMGSGEPLERPRSSRGIGRAIALWLAVMFLASFVGADFARRMGAPLGVVVAVSMAIGFPLGVWMGLNIYARVKAPAEPLTRTELEAGVEASMLRALRSLTDPLAVRVGDVFEQREGPLYHRRVVSITTNHVELLTDENPNMSTAWPIGWDWTKTYRRTERGPET